MVSARVDRHQPLLIGSRPGKRRRAGVLTENSSGGTRREGFSEAIDRSCEKARREGCRRERPDSNARKIDSSTRSPIRDCSTSAVSFQPKRVPSNGRPDAVIAASRPPGVKLQRPWLNDVARAGAQVPRPDRIPRSVFVERPSLSPLRNQNRIRRDIAMENSHLDIL